MVSLPPWLGGGAVVSLTPWLGGGAVVSGEGKIIVCSWCPKLNVYCPECPPGGTIVYRVDSKKRFCRSVTEGT